MRYFTVNDKKRLKEVKGKLNALDRAILTKCDGIGMNILRVIKAGKPYVDRGSKQFATTDDILRAVSKLQKLGLLERR